MAYSLRSVVKIILFLASNSPQIQIFFKNFPGGHAPRESLQVAMLSTPYFFNLWMCADHTKFCYIDEIPVPLTVDLGVSTLKRAVQIFHKLRYRNK